MAKKPLYVDFTPSGAPAGVASWNVSGRSVWEWQAQFLQKDGVRQILVLDTAQNRSLAAKSPFQVKWIAQAPKPEEALVLPMHVVYDKVGFRNALNGRAELKDCVLWTIKGEGDLSSACSEWVRNEWLPFHSDYIKHLAHSIAGALVHTPITPNMLTLGTLLCALSVFLMLYFDWSLWNWAAPILIIFAVVLDFADGRLARLKNCPSAFGGFLDSVVGDLTEDICYLGVLVYLYFHNTAFHPYTFILGTFYFFGKYQAYLSLVYQTKYLTQPQIEAQGTPAEPLSSQNKLAWFFVVFEFTVVRYHFLALFLLLRMPEVPLVFYTLHFNARWILRSVLVTMRHLK